MLKIAVVGASPKEDRYSHKAMNMLTEEGYCPIPVAPGHKEILGKKVYHSLKNIEECIDTVTMYIGKARQEDIITDIINIKPRRVIFNPGTENPEVYDILKDAEIIPIEACTLVMLKTNSF